MEQAGQAGHRLDGKVAVVTGAGRGIGRAVALTLAANGAKVVVNDVGAGLAGEGADAGPAQDTVREIEREHGQGAAVASTDSVAEWDGAQAIVAAATGRYGRLDIVVNNAGILRDRIFHHMTPEAFDAVVKVHLYGSFNVSRAAAEVFRGQNSGAFVHMTSTSGLIGSVGQANYAAAKMGIAGLSRAIAMDMARYGVRSNCIAPHAFSRMIESVPGRSPEEQERLMEQRRASTRPDQVAQLAAFSGIGRGGRCERADLRRARQRDLPLQPAAGRPHPAPQRRVDAGQPGRGADPRPAHQLHPLRAQRHGLQLGADLTAADVDMWRAQRSDPARVERRTTAPAMGGLKR